MGHLHSENFAFRFIWQSNQAFLNSTVETFCNSACVSNLQVIHVWPSPLAYQRSATGV